MFESLRIVIVGDTINANCGVIKMYENYEELFSQNKDNYKRYENVDYDLILGNTNKIKNPFITIAIPTFKRIDLLKLAINSAINQDDVSCEYEIIVVDNEPSITETETEKLIKAYRNEKILYFRNKENIGMFGNWNRCIELARGEWIAFLHDDDMLDKKYLSKVKNLLNRKKDVGALVGSVEIIKDNSEDNTRCQSDFYFKSFIRKVEEKKLMKISDLDSLIMNGNIYGAPTCGSIFRRKYLEDFGGFDEGYFPSADWMFALKYSKTYNFYRTSSLFGYYRMFDNESLKPKTLKEFIRQAEEVRKYYAEKTIFGKVLKIFFENEQYFSSLSWVKNMGSDSNVNFEEINSEYGYRYRPMRFKIFKFIQLFYWYCFKRIFSFIFG